MVTMWAGLRTRVAVAAALLTLPVVGTVGGASPAQAWQASGQNGRIAWASKTSGNFDIWTMNADGSDKRDITPGSSAADYQPEWSPDGAQIAYVHEVAVGDPRIWVMNADGSSPHQVVNAAAWKPTWSPDGTEIGFEQQDNWAPPHDITSIRAIRLASGVTTTFALGNASTNTDIRYDWPSWDPSGRRIAAVMTDKVNGTVDADSSGLRVFVEPPGSPADCGSDLLSAAWHPAYSPDGHMLAFILADDVFLEPAGFANGSLSYCSDGASNLTIDSAQQGYVSWSPDGRRVIFSEGAAGHTKLVSRSISDASDSVALTDDASDNNDPSWTSVPPVVPPPAQAATCNGLPVTVDVNKGQVPTAGNDVILGTAGADTIKAGGGNDVVCGGEGNDVLIGQSGKDKLFGEGGNDVLKGGGGKDVCTGGPGVDKAKTCEKVRSLRK